MLTASHLPVATSWVQIILLALVLVSFILSLLRDSHLQRTVDELNERWNKKFPDDKPAGNV